MISVVIVNYKSSSYLKKLLVDLEASMQGYDYEVVIVDNASGESEIEELKKLSGRHIRCVFLDRNVGFGAANNIGVRYSNGEYIVLINPDVEIPHGQNLGQFIEQALTAEVGVLAPKILWPNGIIQPNCQKFPNFLTYLFHILRAGPLLRKLNIHQFFAKFLDKVGLLGKGYVGSYFDNYTKSATTVKECDWVSGAFVVLRKEVFDKIGGFDENFFLYSEDVDFCRRVKRAGLKIIRNSTFTVVHFEGGTQNKRKVKKTTALSLGQKERYKSRLYYLYKHNGLLSYLLMKLIFSIDICVKALSAFFSGNIPYAVSSLSFVKELLSFRPRKIKALVLGYFGRGSFGDELILKELIEEFLVRNEEMIVSSYSPRKTSKENHIRAVGKFNPITLLSAMFSANELWIGPGGLFNLRNTHSYAYYFLLAMFAKALRKKICIKRVGLQKGALHRNSNRILFKLLLRLANSVSVRDKTSYDELKKAYPELINKVLIEDDIVIDVLKRDRNAYVSKMLKNVEKKKILGINITEACVDYSKIAKIVHYFKGKGYSIRYLEANTREDKNITERFIKEYQLMGDILTFNSYSDVDLFCKAIAECELVISMRYHVLVIAYFSGSRCIAVPWNSKIEDFARSYDVEMLH